MLVRSWITRIDESRAAEYAAFARQRSVPMFRMQPGFLGAFFGARAGERLVLTVWKDLQAVEALETSESYKRTVAAIEAAGFLAGRSSVNVFALEGAALEEGFSFGCPVW